MTHHADIDDVDPRRTLIVCTGSQSEPRAALTQMATGQSKWLTLDSGDTVVFSSHPIPGNETAVASVRQTVGREPREAGSTGCAVTKKA